MQQLSWEVYCERDIQRFPLGEGGMKKSVGTEENGLLWGDVVHMQWENTWLVATVWMCHMLAASDDLSCRHCIPWAGSGDAWLLTLSSFVYYKIGGPRNEWCWSRNKDVVLFRVLLLCGVVVIFGAQLILTMRIHNVVVSLKLCG